MIGSVAMLVVSWKESSKTSTILRGFVGFMALATGARIFQLQYERMYPSVIYTEWGSYIERPANSVAGQISAFLDRNLLMLCLITSIFMYIILDKEASSDALKHSKVLYFTAMFWIGIHYLYLVAVTLFVPCLIICFPCVVVGMRWIFQLGPPLPTDGRNDHSRNGPATEEALSRIWKVHYHPDQDYSTPTQHLPIIPKEDTKCSICLGWYEQGDELRILPCLHHFHRECADHWLKITATCPLCVRSAIIPEEEPVGSEMNV